jgi:hypothetical protein
MFNLVFNRPRRFSKFFNRPKVFLIVLPAGPKRFQSLKTSNAISTGCPTVSKLVEQLFQ